MASSLVEACHAPSLLRVVPDLEQAKKTTLGYLAFRCAACKRRLNERRGTPFNDLSVPTGIVFLVVLWRLRYPLRLRHLAEMFRERGSSSATRRCAPSGAA